MATQASFNPHDLLNQTIGGYQLCEILGTGAAVVYRAYDPGKAEYVALKLLAWPGAPLDDIALRRFKREIDLLRKRRHAAIVDIYDWRTNGDYVYMAMEYCDGTLQRWLREHRPTLTEVLEIAEPLAAALDFLHEGPAPVLHRDIKPANILYRGRNWYISDFGIARMEADQLVTTDGTLLGTLRYAAPEQMTAAKLGVETDIYSFGLVIYEMLAGGWVLGARRPTDWAYDVPPISTYHRGLGPAVDALFERWLAPNPAQRPRRAVDAVRELAAASGVLRDPALARLYDLATTLSDRPNDPAAWEQASELLAAIAYHEPAFFDPRGLSADLEARRGAGAPGPAPPGYSGAYPTDFYSGTTIIAPPGTAAYAPDGVAAEAPPADEAAAARLLPPADLGEGTFRPRTRYDADGTLHVPAKARVGGSVFGRSVVIDADARVDGDVYSLGDLTLAPHAEIGGLALAGGRLEAGRESWIHGGAGAQAGQAELGRGARVGGWVGAGGATTVDPGVEAGGVLAGGPVAFRGPARLGAATVGSTAGALDVAEPLLLAGTPADTDAIHAWRPDGAEGHLVSSLFTRRGRALAEQAQQVADSPATLPSPRPVSPAEPPLLQTSPATEGPTLYLPHALAPDPATPPPGLPAADAPGAWEAALVGAWMLDQVWADLLRRLRGPLLVAGIVALVGGLVIAGLALGGQGTWAGPLALVWIGLVLLTLGALWLARPRPLELTRVWWAWETWGLEKGVVVWDTLDPGEGLGYPEPETPLAPLEAQASDAAEVGLDDAEVLMRLLKLNSALEGLRWKSWPGVFAAKPPAPAAEAEAAPPLPSAADELAALPVDIPPPELFPHMRVLVPRLDPEQVRAAAERLAGWPAYQTAAREVWRQINAHLQDLTPLLDGWDAAAGAAADSVAAATQALAAHRARATQLADEAAAALEADIAPDLDRVWQLHVEGGKLLSSYIARALEEERAAGYRAQDRAAAQVTAAERDLRRQESLLAEIGAGLRPLEAQWAEAGAAHQRLGADLQQAWREVRAQRPPAGDDPAYVAARAVDIRQAGTLVPQLAQETTRLIRQGEEFMAACAREERDLPAELPWPAWPARISMPLAVEADLTALNGVLRRLRAEPVRARARLDSLRTLLGKTTLTLERALGAQEALAHAGSTASAEAAGEPPAEPGRLAGLESQAAGLIRRLHPLLTDLQHWQRRLELTSVSYVELADSLAEALKGGRHGPPWQQGQRLQAEHVRLEADQAAAAGQYDAARATLAAAQDEVERIRVSTENTLAHLTRMEQDLMARSEEYAGQEETACRRHVEQIRARHAAVLAALGERGDWLRALADFDRTGAAAKIHAVERLRERVQLRTALADGRIADTAEARSQAFWPLDSWPAGDMLYLLPVWLLRYRPFGRAGAPRVLAVTPGHVRAAARGRFRPAPGFVVDPLPGLAARFGADLGDSAAAGPDLSAALEGENVLRPGGPVPAQWRDLAARGLVAPWLPRLI